MNDITFGLFIGVFITILIMFLIRDLIIKHFINSYIKVHMFPIQEGKEELLGVINELTTYLYPIVSNLLDNKDKYSLTTDDITILSSFRTLIDLEKSDNS